MDDDPAGVREVLVTGAIVLAMAFVVAAFVRKKADNLGHLLVGGGGFVGIVVTAFRVHDWTRAVGSGITVASLLILALRTNTTESEAEMSPIYRGAKRRLDLLSLIELAAAVAGLLLWWLGGERSFPLAATLTGVTIVSFALEPFARRVLPRDLRASEEERDPNGSQEGGDSIA